MQKQAELYRGKAKTVYSTENPGPVGARIPQ
ncbi:phosphoribosylaminoimidazole-succinocarboxamide synthase [Escherichia coli]|nr:phosphoribosylaminoimidazole-succinocarboxamide synthase [Escherichia coli]